MPFSSATIMQFLASAPDGIFIAFSALKVPVKEYTGRLIRGDMIFSFFKGREDERGYNWDISYLGGQ